MSDLIARLEQRAVLFVEEFEPDSVTQILLEEAAAALRQKETKIAELSADLHDAQRAIKIYCDSYNAAEAQISALRDQQPVAWINRERGLATTDPTTKDRYPGTYDALVYAHPSCVSPEQPEKQNTGDTSGVASDQSKRGADSNESADHP